jgi:hypothetical protein
MHIGLYDFLAFAGLVSFPLIGGTRETRRSRGSETDETRQTEKTSAVHGVKCVGFKVRSIDPLQTKQSRKA